jgi:tetratricopeptide (TPR) repeat protein
MLEEVNETIKLTEWIRDRWQKPSTLVLVLFLTLLVGLFLSHKFDLAEFATSISWIEVVLIVAAMILVVVGWVITTRIPETPPNKIGILVAIDCESKMERQRLKSDFVNALREAMIRRNHQQYVVLELSEYHSRMIHSHEEAMRYLKQTASHLMVYGQCKVRAHQNRPTYVLELNASVRHAPIPIEISRQFSKDMDLAFPRKALIPKAEELRGFELTRELVGLASRYILGIASLISGNPVSAFDLHYGVWTELRKNEEEGKSWPGPKQLTARVASLLVEDALVSANLRFTKKPPNYLDDMKNFLDVAQEIHPNHYGGHLLRGIHFFLSSRDVERAKGEIKKAKNERDSTWLWSSAFLDAYDGRLEEAHKTYQRAFRGLVTDDTPLQVETFIVDVVNLEPDKIQLWYCLGMINYFYKEDLPSALRDFRSFCEKAEHLNRFNKSVEFAKKYIEEIEDKLESQTVKN